jgi:predicted chitinase
MSYVDTLDGNQKEAIRLMVASMNKRGITNKFMQAGIIAIVSKESNFRPKSEGGYGGTSIERIRKVFGGKVADLTDAELEVLKKDNVAFFNKVYGGRYGNAPNEGYKYRGRGLNQITFKGNYEAMNRYTDEDIVANPDLLNTLPVAVDVMVGYYLRNFNSSRNKLDEYNMSDMNDAKTLEDAVGAAYHATAGWGKDKATIERRNSNGRKRAFARMGDLYEYAKEIDPESDWEEPEDYEGPSDDNNQDNNQQSDDQGGSIGTSISASVGKGAVNKKADVKVVQDLLNKKISAGLTVDGLIGPKTIGAIKDFQQTTFGWADGRVDVGGKTWGALAEGAAADDGGDEPGATVNPIPLDASIYPCFN